MKGRRDAAPQKPWYLVIGPAGAGKSSMLANSGLSFREEPAITPDLIAAIGDLGRYWEADNAVFLECAGRLVEAAASEADETAWIALLEFLKRRRRQRPFSGAIVAAPLEALTSGPGSEAEPALRRARKRIAQVEAVLAVRLPVYVVVTKADRLPGFAAFFDGLTRAEREQVWGVTSSWREGLEAADGVELLARGIDDLREPLSRGVLARLHDEDDPSGSAEIFAFPRAFASLTARLRALVEAFGAGSRPQPAPRLRGLYLTAAPEFFVKRLFAEVILVEEALVTLGGGDSPKRRRLRQIGATLGAAAAVGIVAFLGFAFSDQSAFLAAAQVDLSRYADAATGLPTHEVADADLGRTARTLSALDDRNAPRLRLGALSLDHSAQVETARRDLTMRALNGLLLPRLLVALQEDMQAAARSRTEVRDDARLYLMLGDRSPFDRSFAERTLTELTERFVVPDARAALRTDIAALLAGPLAPIVLDPVVSEDAQALAAQ